jgi:hypothetical protein
MLNLVFLLAFFTQLSPSNLAGFSSLGPAEFSVEFPKLNGIQVGAPVVLQGQLIGTVANISSLAEGESLTGLNKQMDDEAGYAIKVRITPQHRGLIRKGTVALIKSPLSAARVKPEVVVEFLLSPKTNSPVLKAGDHIVGYSSFEEFWSADLSQRGLPNDVFSIS